MRLQFLHPSPLPIEALPLEPAPDDAETWMRSYAGELEALEVIETDSGWPLALVRGRDGRVWAFYRFYHYVGAALVAATPELRVQHADAVRLALRSAQPDFSDRVLLLSDLWNR